MDLEARGQGACFGCRQVLVEDGIGVGVQIILDQHDFFWPAGSARPSAAESGSSRPQCGGPRPRQALACAELKNHQQAGRAMAYKGRTIVGMENNVKEF